MAVEIWPHVPPDQLKEAIESAEKRELDWFVHELRETLTNIKHGLEDCYALLAPIEPGSTLVLSTPRNEVVKGHITRVGTRIVKGTIHLRLRTLPYQTLVINPDHPMHLGPLTSLHSLLTDSINLLTMTLSYAYPSDAPVPTTTHPAHDQPPPPPPPSSTPQFLSAQLRLLSQSLGEAFALLKGPPLPTADPTWTTRSAAPAHFVPPLAQPEQSSAAPALSFHLSVQDSSLVLWLRVLEPADAPVNFGTKLALAIGTARRLEHDETDRLFGYCCGDAEEGDGDEGAGEGGGSSRGDSSQNDNNDDGNGGGDGRRIQRPTSPDEAPASQSGKRGKRWVDVFVREKVRVESADPSLLALSAKLAALGHALSLARRNLAAVMGEEMEGED